MVTIHLLSPRRGMRCWPAVLVLALMCMSPSAVHAAGLIDSFENDNALSDGSGADGKWVVGSGTYTLTYESNRTFFSKGAMRVDYNKAGTAYTWIEIKGVDTNIGANFSNDTFMTARVFGAVSILAKFRDDDCESDVQVATTTNATGWSLVTWKYNPNAQVVGLCTINPNNIKDMLFFVAPGDTAPSGTFYMDNLWLGYGYPNAPDTVTNLIAVPGPKNGQARLSWTAIGDTNGQDRVKQYLIRQSTSTITESGFNSLTDLTGIPAPSAAGTLDSMIVSGLTAGQTYYFAIKAVDTNSQTDSLSNVAQPAALSSSAGSLVFDDFSDGYTKPNGFGKDVGQWSSGGATIFISTAAPANSLGNIGGALDITYNRGTGECGYYSVLGETDLSAYKGISFWARGALGGEEFLIGLKSVVNGKESKLRAHVYLKQARITAAWQKIVIPFAAFNKLDPSEVATSGTPTNPLTKMENVSFTFGTQTASASGQVFIDDIAFVKSVPVVFLENFDTTADPSEGTHAAGGNEGDLNTNNDDPFIVENGHAKLTSTIANQGVFLTLLQFGDSTGLGDKTTPFIEATHISLYARGNVGGESLEINLQDKYNQSRAVNVRDVLGTALPAVWTKVSVPLILFPGVDMTFMDAVHIRLAEAGKIAFIDSIVFDDSATPTAPSNLLLNGVLATANAPLTTRNTLSVTADDGATDVSMQEVRFEYSTTGGSDWSLIGVDRDVADNTYQVIWVTRNIAGAPFYAAVPVNLSYRAVAVDVAGNTTATAALAASTINTSNVVVYPNPYYPLQGGKMKITNLSTGATVNIYTLSGELVVQLLDSDNDGQVDWTGVNKGGDRVASGLYLYEAILSAGRERGKLVVIK